jgi:superfamily II DNA or RNA helicase
MLLDNSTDDKKVINWINSKTPNDVNFKAITGYFTIGALYDVLKSLETSKEISVIFGDILTEEAVDVPIDLINGNIKLEDAFQIPEKAEYVIEKLKEDRINIKVLEPNFCHAKVYLAVSTEINQGYYITGSSNLTEAGLGIKKYHNIELNILGGQMDSQFKELNDWFDALWIDDKARTKITLPDKSKKDVKEYLIELISAFTKEYDPLEIYYKILFELFRNVITEGDDPQFLKDLGRLENSKVYRSLFEFQQKGVLSLIKMLNKYNGAILADAVGLGKTWSALAVIKHFQNKGYKTVLLVPKKLEQNWRAYQYHQGSQFEEDHFDYVIRFHTDLQDERIDNKADGLKLKSFFQSNEKKLFVIDESHNLRNSKSGRFKYLVDNVLNDKVNPNHKVLMLSATPINTSFTDVRNQFKLMINNSINGFAEHFGITNIDSLFQRVQKEFAKWREDEYGTIQELINQLPNEFAILADHLIVARTRNVIKGMAQGLDFPTLLKPVDNFYETPSEMGTFETFEDLVDHFPEKMAAYSPYLYIKDDNIKSVLEDEAQRDFFLVKMMQILMVKRLESSWYGFFETTKKIREKTNNVFELIKEYEKGNKHLKILAETGEDVETEEEEDFSFHPEDGKYTIGKRELMIKEIEDSGMLETMKKDLKEDLDGFDLIISNLEKFSKLIDGETGLKSIDTKLEKLIEYIHTKQKNSPNKKILIFSAYRDTAYYLYTQLKKRGINKTAMVSGSEAYYYKSTESFKSFNSILERFCPYTKLYREKVWREFEATMPADFKKTIDNYPEWVNWIKLNDEEATLKLDEEIEILIATDCLSEGQNLQDCDCVVNYDIHWNPVRIIQRVGRVDRLGSPNETFKVANFWPTDSIDKYLTLEGRIVDRLVAARLAGTEIEKDLMERLQRKMVNDSTESKQKEKLIRELEQNVTDIEGNESFGFDNLSLDVFRQDLIGHMNGLEGNKWRGIPKGSFSGFVSHNEDFLPEEGVIALMGYPAQKKYSETHVFKHFKLVYIGKDGKPVHSNQMKTLNALNMHRNEIRVVPELLDQRDSATIQMYREILVKYFDQFADDSTFESKKTKKDNLDDIMSGNIKSLKKVFESEEGVDALVKKENYDLLAWVVVQK